jgi:membrane protease YdiL (CAAX protease family)
VAIAVVPVLLALMIVSQVIARLIVRPVFPNGVHSVADPIAGIIGFLSIYLGLWVWLRSWSIRPFWSLGFEHQRVLQRVLHGALVAALMVLAVAGLMMIAGASLLPGELRTRGLAAIGPGLLTLLATTVQSSAEEALFRGCLLSRIALSAMDRRFDIFGAVRHREHSPQSGHWLKVGCGEQPPGTLSGIGWRVGCWAC